MMHDDGVIKFVCDWQVGPALAMSAVASLIHWRDRLWIAKQIGLYPDGIGYGNISQKRTDQTFVISGTQTGQFAHSQPEHYTLVDQWDLHNNTLHCTGPIKASSESLTHAALYEYTSEIQAIIHVHNRDVWQQYQHVLPTTRASVPYGTPEMAYEMWRLMAEGDLLEQRILIMAGHEEGVIVFGPSLETAAQVLFQYQPENT